MENEKTTIPQTEAAPRNIEVNIIPLLTAVAKKLWLILLCAIIGMLLFRVGTYVLIKPTYLSSFTAYVNNKAETERDAIAAQDIQASKELVETYSRILTSNSVLEAAADFCNLDMPYEVLSQCVTTEIVNKTQLIKVNVVTTDKTTSFKLAQAIAKIAPVQMSRIIKGSSMEIVDAAKEPKGRFGPNYFTASLFGFLTGAVLALAYVLIQYFRDDTMKNEADLEARYNLPVVGIIPNMLETKSFNYAQNGYYQTYETVKKEDK